MIIYTVDNLKIYETRSDKPNSDWTDRSEFIVDETDPKNKGLIDKILKYAPFMTLVTNENNQLVDVTEDQEARAAWELKNQPPVERVLKEKRDTKLQEISTACNNAIVAGIDIETTQGVQHFSLEETDQINLSAAFTAIQQGATEYPYHADKQLCRMFTAAEIVTIMTAATQHKVYHTTLCNHLLSWTRRAETVEELETITYSADNLPEDLATNMQAILTSAASATA